MDRAPHESDTTDAGDHADATFRLNRAQGSVQRMFLQHTGALEGYIYSIVPQSSDADEIYQQTFLTAIRKAEDYDSTQPFRHWLFGIARYEIRGWFRDRARHSERFISMEAMEALSEDVSEQPAVSEDELTLLERCLRQLTPSSRRLLRQHYFDGQSGAEIAELLGMQLQSVYNGLNRARAVLRDCMEHELAQLRNADGGSS